MNDRPVQQLGLAHRPTQNGTPEQRAVAAGAGARRINEADPLSGMFGPGSPAMPVPDAALNILNRQALENLPEVQRALLRLAEEDRAARPATATLNQTRSDLVALAGSEWQPQPNVLDSYANYTYHIRLSMMSDVDAYSSTVLANFDRINKLVIAESGVTVGFNITDFEIENMCSPGPRVQAMTHTNFKMTIKEPYGLSLVDRIYSYAQTMGVINHLTSPYFIEVWFTGYDENGEIATTELKQQLYKVFRVNITKIISDTTSSGTVYSIDGIFDGMYANADHVAIPAGSIRLNRVTTVGDFFTQLESSLNAQQGELQYDQTARIEYRFRMTPEMASWPLVQRPTASQRNADISVESYNSGTNFAPTISIARGMDISTILYFVISMTEAGRNFVAGTSTRTSEGNPNRSGRSNANLGINGMANLVAIHSQTEIIGFDYLINDYIRRVTYTFTEYPTARAIIDVSTARNALTPNAQRDRAQSQLRSRRFLKAYEYIYTGRNLDIIRMDIKLELTWAAAIPLHLGENTYTNFTSGPIVDPNSAATSILNRYRQAVQRREQARTIESQLTGVSNPSREQRDQLQVARRQFQEAEAEIRNLRVNRGRDFQILWDSQGGGSRALENIRANESLLLDRQVASDVARRLRWSQASRTRQDRYLEDVTVLPVDPQQRIPVSFRLNPGPTNQTTNQAGQSEPDRAAQRAGAPPRGRGLIATVLNDVMSAPYLLTVNLEIRGDPYWLGMGNIQENSVISTLRGSSPPIGSMDEQSAWFFNGEVGFLLTFRTGEAPSEESGFMEFKQSSVAFAGLYIAIKIRNIFKDGRFSQIIEAYKDPLLELSAVNAGVLPEGIPMSEFIERASSSTELRNLPDSSIELIRNNPGDQEVSPTTPTG